MGEEAQDGGEEGEVPVVVVKEAEQLWGMEGGEGGADEKRMRGGREGRGRRGAKVDKGGRGREEVPLPPC